MGRAARIGIIATAALALALPAHALALGAGGIKGNSSANDNPVFSGDGRYLVFSSNATNLTPAHLGGTIPMFRRDLDTGAVDLVSQPGVFTSGSPPSVSADGRYIAFYGVPAAPQSGIYVRDMQAGTFTLASRADGPSGAPATGVIRRPSMSADGRFVAFHTTAALDAADTDDYADVYLRDLQNETTVLVSRASDSVGGADAESPAEDPSISADGRFVAFKSAAPGLALPEDVYCICIYVRDLATNTTELVSRLSGESGAVPFNSGSTSARISGDGAIVVFQSQTQLHPDDTDDVNDVYVRDRAADTTELVNRVSGPGGPAADGTAAAPSITPDGRFAAFVAISTNVTPDAGGCFWCAFIRDLQTQTNVLVSRATGTGTAGATINGGPAMSDNGSLVAFASQTSLHPDDPDTTNDLFVRDVQAETTWLEHRATPGYERYVRPKGATPFRVPLVPVAQQCTAPNRQHGPPLAFASCNPPAPASPNLTVGIGDGNPLLARSEGFLRTDVVLSPPSSADVTLRMRLTNVMTLPGGADYTGELRAATQVRTTDKFSGPGTNEEATMTDLTLGFTVPCVATASTLDGATCSVNTSTNAVLPGFARRGGRIVYELDQVQVFDGGPDSDADTQGDNSLFAVQGLFVP